MYQAAVLDPKDLRMKTTELMSVKSRVLGKEFAHVSNYI